MMGLPIRQFNYYQSPSWIIFRLKVIIFWFVYSTNFAQTRRLTLAPLVSKADEQIGSIGNTWNRSRGVEG